MILCVVDWNLSHVLTQLEVAPVLNTAELLSPRIYFSYEFDEGCGGNDDLVDTTSCCDEFVVVVVRATNLAL